MCSSTPRPRKMLQDQTKGLGKASMLKSFGKTGAVVLQDRAIARLALCRPKEHVIILVEDNARHASYGAHWSVVRRRCVAKSIVRVVGLSASSRWPREKTSRYSMSA